MDFLLYQGGYRMKTTNIITDGEQKLFEVSQMTVQSNVSNETAINEQTDRVKLCMSEEDGVILEISDEAKKKYAEQMQVLNQLKQMAEQNRKANEKQNEEGDELSKIMTIFRRIANGDIVPASDEKKLMEYNQEMYMAAKNIASMKENKDPEEYDSVDKEKKHRSCMDEAMEEYVAERNNYDNQRISKTCDDNFKSQAGQEGCAD